MIIKKSLLQTSVQKLQKSKRIGRHTTRLMTRIKKKIVITQWHEFMRKKREDEQRERERIRIARITKIQATARAFSQRKAVRNSPSS